MTSTAKSVILNEWDTTINNFDTTKDVTVQRIDITGDSNAEVSLYSKESPLQITEGPIYFFHNATQLIMEDLTSKNYSAGKTDAVVWIAKGTCLQLHVTLSSQGEASLMAVTSGKVKWTPSHSVSVTCGTSNVLVGAGTAIRP